jgi:hypothetical protein
MRGIWQCVVFNDINLQKSISIILNILFFWHVLFWDQYFWESVAYSWPWENIGVLKFKLTCLMNWPCDLLIVIAITTSNENYFLVNVKGICNCKVTLEMNVVSPTRLPINICASMTQLLKHVIISCQNHYKIRILEQCFTIT